MKLKLTIISLFVAFGAFAQKQLQPYTFSLSDNGNTETIMIYASAETVNSITFTLKNDKNETLQTKKEDGDEKVDITFKVFPFTEVSFRTHLVDAISSIHEEDESKKKYDIFTSTLEPLQKSNANSSAQNQLSKRKDAVQNVRNIYQFFNALAITAFQYDNEPVAGILKYQRSVIAVTQNINGIDTDKYFNALTKYITKAIKDSKGNENEFKNQLNNISDIDSTNADGNNNLKMIGFLEFLAEKRDTARVGETEISKRNHKAKLKNEIKCLNDNYRDKDSSLVDSEIITYIAKLNISTKNTCVIENVINKNEGYLYITPNNVIVHKTSYLMDLFEYYQNMDNVISNVKRKNKKLKNHIKRQLEKWYNEYAYKNFMKNEFANTYFKYKYRKNICENIISAYNKLNKNSDERIVKIKSKDSVFLKSIETLNNELKIIDTEIKNTYINNNRNARVSYLEPKEEKLKNKIDSLKKEKAKLKTLTSKEINLKKKHKKEIEVFEDMAKSFQNDINFLIAGRKSQIIDIPFWRFDIDNIEIDINDGFIEHITATGKALHPEVDKIAILNSIEDWQKVYYVDTDLEKAIKEFYEEPLVKDIFADIMGNYFKFDNEFPIGFSSKSDFADLANYKLYAFEGERKVFSLPLNNIIKLYIQRHQNDRLNFSPKDQVVRLPTDDPNGEMKLELKKEKSSKILNTKVFTDFNGLKESEPNGLVQFEVEKEVPIFTRRWPLNIGRSSNWGLGNYAIFNLTWAKLNEEDRELQVLKAPSVLNNQPQTDNYITYLDLIRFENISVGVDLNVLSFDFPLVKTRVELNAGVHYGRVKVIDDVSNPTDDNPEATIRQFEKDVNMIRIYPDVIVRIRPEERFGGYLRFRPFRTIVPDNEEFFTVYSADDFLQDPNNRQDAIEDQRWLQRYELGAFYTPSAESDNKFFFRYRYTNTSIWETNGYSEIQLGYQIYLRF
ncbi:hypothetical protein [Winogradskyella sp.]|uniref:hypothetical protein n=1 Tax=Winogradskyella sp. TaxID=1883156 RepID=UPI00261085E5|nr:hypothetical protein [Winogradskyella sp.]